MLPWFDQTRRVARRLSNGEFFRDGGSATAVLFRTVHALPLAVAENIHWFPQLTLQKSPLGLNRAWFSCISE